MIGSSGIILLIQEDKKALRPFQGLKIGSRDTPAPHRGLFLATGYQSCGIRSQGMDTSRAFGSPLVISHGRILCYTRLGGFLLSHSEPQGNPGAFCLCLLRISASLHLCASEERRKRLSLNQVILIRVDFLPESLRHPFGPLAADETM